MKIVMNQAAERKLEKDLQKKFDAAVSKHPFKKGESLADIQKTLAKLFKSLGVTPNARDMKVRAQGIFDKLNK